MPGASRRDHSDFSPSERSDDTQSWLAQRDRAGERYENESHAASSNMGDLEDMPGNMAFIMEGQRKLQQQTEEMMQRIAASNSVMQGHRRLEEQLETLTQHVSGDGGSPGRGPPQRSRHAQHSGLPQQGGPQQRGGPTQRGGPQERDGAMPRDGPLQRDGPRQRGGPRPRDDLPQLGGSRPRDGPSQRAGLPEHDGPRQRDGPQQRGSAPQHDGPRQRDGPPQRSSHLRASPPRLHDHSGNRTSTDSLSETVGDRGEDYADLAPRKHVALDVGEDGRHMPPISYDEEHDEHVSVQRKALRLISWRRNETMQQLHGDTFLHHTAWIFECGTCFAFSVASLVMLALWARHVNEEAFVNTFFVTSIAAMTYFAKSCHMGDIILNGQVVPLARYIDWITTTPLMLYEVCHIAHASAGMTIMVILCDLLMLATGIIAALVPWKPHKGLKQIWFIFSCLFYILMLVVLQYDVSKKASKQIEVAANLFKQLEVLTVVMWSFYPVVVGMGRAHFGCINKPMEDILLCILDVVSKIGMEGLIVASCFSGCLGEGGDH